MRRREFLAAVGGAAAWPFVTYAQPSGTSMRQIGYVGSVRQPAPKSPFDCFNAGLRDLGWIEGRNINIIYKGTDSSSQGFADATRDLVKLQPELIVTTSTPATLAAKAATDRIPVVFISVSDPVASGVVKSLARPHGNLTGVSNFLPATTAKLLELISVVAPKTSRVGVLYDPANAGKLLEVGELRAAAETLRVQLVSMEAKSTGDLERVLSIAVETGCHAVITLLDGVTIKNKEQITEFVSRNKLLGIYQVSDFVEAGGLMSYGLNYCRHFRRASSFVDRILKGSKPADLPVEQPTEFELVINMKVARALGLDIPATLLARADEVIE